MKPTELKQLPPKILLYGRAGSGKTALTYTLGPDLQVLEFDHGWTTALSLKDGFTEARRNVDIIECYHDRPDFPNAVDKVKSALARIQQQILVTKNWPFKYLALDSLTALGEAALQYVLKNSGHTGKNPTQPEWGLAILEVQHILDILRALPVPVIVCAHDQTLQIDDRTETRINIIGQKLPQQLPIYFDEIWFLRGSPGAAGKTNYIIQTTQSTSVLARTRWQIPDGTNQNKGMPELLKMLADKPT